MEPFHRSVRDTEAGRDPLRRFVTPPLAAAAGISLAAFLAIGYWAYETGGRLSAERAAEVVNAIEDGLDRRLMLVRATAAHMAADNDSNRARFQAFAANILPAAPGVQALGWLPRTPAQGIPALEEEARRDGLAEYRVTGNHGDGLPAEVYPVHFLVPAQGNEKLFGYDAFSLPDRSQAMVSARDSGGVAVSERVNLVQAPNGAAVIFMMPVFDGGAVPDSMTERRARLNGFIAASFHVGQFIEDTLHRRSLAAFNMRLVDLAAAPEKRLLYVSQAADPSRPMTAEADNAFEHRLAIGGRHWSIQLSPDLAMGLNSEVVPIWGMLVAGLAAVTFLVWHLLVTKEHSRHIEALAGGLGASNDALRQEVASRAAAEASLQHSIDALAAARLEAERANRSKSHFLAAACHDLRQPLHAQALFCHLLEADATTDRQRRLLDLLAHSIRATDDLFSSIMDVSSLESGRVEPKIEPLPIREIVDHIFAETGAAAAAKGLTLTVGNCGNEFCAGVILSDPVLLQRMLRNLVNNALRYTKTGGITLSCGCEDDWTTISVEDTGPGIPADKLDTIFEAYYRIGEDGERSGLGLGLATVSRMAALLDHQVTVMSEVGVGSVFAVRARRRPPGGPGAGQAGTETCL